MHPQYPIECTCSHRRERSQLPFARRAAQILPGARDAAFEPADCGLVLLAETETALERPLAILREVYGELLDIGPLTVRYRRGKTVEEPHMGVRVLCSKAHFEAVRADLQRRGAAILDAEATHFFGVVRASAPLAALLGYSRALAELTRGGGREVMWLSHYAPVIDRA